MSKNYKPENYPTLLPYFTVTDAEKAIKFYQEAFDFKLLDASKDQNGKIQHVEMSKGGAYIMFCPEGAFGSPNKAPVTLGVNMPLTLYIYCENVDALYATSLTQGAQSKYEPNDGFWGDRFCSVTDPDGYEWSFATRLNR